MILSRLTWPEVEALDREVVVLIPTGSLEQHGAHLPLYTDTLLATAVAEAVEKNLPSQCLLTPCLWLGASLHHLGFAGTLSASFEAYEGALSSVVESLIPHGFHKFFVLNGHGGNDEPNGVVMRRLKSKHPSCSFGHKGYFEMFPDEMATILEGPSKQMRHACEAEASLMLHLHPELARTERLRDDGLKADPPVPGMVHNFDEISQEGSTGYASLASAEKGKRLFEAATKAATTAMRNLADGYALVEP